MRNIALCLFGIFFVGCASAPSMKASKSEFLAGPAPVGTKAEDIRDDIKRGDQDKDPGNPLDMGTVYVEAWPYTQAFVEAQVKELATKNADSDEEMQKQMASQKKDLLDRSCFAIVVRSRDIEHGEFKSWRVKLTQNGKTEELELLNKHGVQSVPDVQQYASYNFVNASTACLKSKIDFNSEFTLLLVPQYQLGHPVTLTWSKTKATVAAK